MAVVGELHISFVCTGNICRSPMAEKIALAHLSRAGLGARVRVSSAGTHDWHTGADADPRTTETLRRHGYPVGHRAAGFGADHADADLVVAMTAEHDRDLAVRGIPLERRRLLRSFDPHADGADVPDPYYGDTAGFELVREQIEAAIPGLLAWVHAALAARAPVTGGAA
ncbi:low molecular weight protein-tyrosine-phosphatase [Nocardia sienata]|uniref:low molecular weight protein-tyrosine-phosphatase n=1 Tax=Nocardia sienata TaxID=248552 RepID=UPI0007A482C8|nr:low molecular weight protein-tyrosine-phosphatase [Nocardia sienata]